MVCAVNLVVQTHPISSALSLVGVMGSLAALYLLLGGEFIAAAQLVVYAGAIMVLFVFVIMLLNAGTERKAARSCGVRWAGAPLLVVFLGLIALCASRACCRHQKTCVFGAFTGGGRAGHRHGHCSPPTCCRLKSPAS